MPAKTLPSPKEAAMYLVRDGYLVKANVPIGFSLSGVPMVEWFEFTEAGLEFVQRWADAQPLDPDEAAVE